MLNAYYSAVLLLRLDLIKRMCNTGFIPPWLPEWAAEETCKVIGKHHKATVRCGPAICNGWLLVVGPRIDIPTMVEIYDDAEFRGDRKTLKLLTEVGYHNAQEME